MVNNLLEMASKLDNIERMLASDSRDITGPAPNLLVIHYQLKQLETFRNQTMHQAKKAKQSSKDTLEKWFERLNSVITAFDEYILELAANVLNLVRAGHSDVVVRLVKIAEAEGREDEKVQTTHIWCMFWSSTLVTGSRPAVCEESCKAGCRPQIQVSSRQCSSPQTLSLQNCKAHRRVYPHKVPGSISTS